MVLAENIAVVEVAADNAGDSRGDAGLNSSAVSHPTRSGPTGPKGGAGKGPADDAAQRRCIVSGEMLPKEMLVRFVVAPDGTVVPDVAGRLPGRGLWLAARRDIIEKACTRNIFSRAAKATVRLPEDLLAQVDSLLASRCLELIGLAKRAGQAVSGYEKSKAWIAAGKVAVLVQACDAAEDGKRKLSTQAQGGVGQSPSRVFVAEAFTAQELGQALGRDARVHVAIAAGGLANRLKNELARLMAVQGGNTRPSLFRGASNGGTPYPAQRESDR